jgi:hypothetical protein
MPRPVPIQLASKVNKAAGRPPQAPPRLVALDTVRQTDVKVHAHKFTCCALACMALRTGRSNP